VLWELGRVEMTCSYWDEVTLMEEVAFKMML